MSSPREVIDYLRDILDAAESAVQFVAGMDFDAFTADKKTTFAVIRALEVVGEATKRIPETVRQRYPEVPWRQMAGMRDKLSHDYINVNARRVFDTVHMDLPPLRSALTRILTDLEGEGQDTKR